MIIAGGIDLSVGSIICIIAVTTSYLTMMQGFGIVRARWSFAIGAGDRDRRRRRALVIAASACSRSS